MHELDPDRRRLSRAVSRPDTTDAYLPLKVLSVYAGLSVRTLRTCLADRLRPLPHYRVGGKILVRRSDFDVWVTQFRVSVKGISVDNLVNDVLQGLG